MLVVIPITFFSIVGVGVIAEEKNWCSNRYKNPVCVAAIEELVDARDEGGTVRRTNNENLVPAWVDVDLFEHGRLCAINQLGVPRFTLAHSINLFLTVGIHELAEINYFRNRSDPAVALSTYTTEFDTIIDWYRQSLKAPGILTSFLQTRLKHIEVMEEAEVRIANSERLVPCDTDLPVDHTLWTAFRQDLFQISRLKPFFQLTPPADKENYIYKRIISQWQMSIVQFTFCGLATLFWTILGLEDDDKCIHGYNHFWAVNGYKLGIKDEYNICLQKNVKDANEYYEEILETEFLPHLVNPTMLSKFMWEAQLGAFSDLNSFLSMKPITPKVILVSLLNMAASKFEEPGFDPSNMTALMTSDELWILGQMKNPTEFWIKGADMV